MIERRPLRVGIDLHVFDGKFQGSRSHVIELFSRVVACSPDIDFYFFLENVDGLRAVSPLFRQKNVFIISMAKSSSVIRLTWQLPRLARRYQLDLLHMQYILPFNCPCPCVATIHDILFESHPEYFKGIFTFRSKILMRLAAKRSFHLFTVSHFSKQEISRVYGVPENAISIIHNGVDTARYFPGDAGADFILNRGLIPGRYILSVGRLEPRKNHITLLRAYSKLGETAPPLVIVGQPDFGYDEVLSFIKASSIQRRVLILSDVGDSELPALYRNASLFVYPSYAEGFGMPPLEALASGVPVVASNTTAIPEVVGDAGVLIAPDDHLQLSDAIRSILNSPELSGEKRIKMARVGKFTWEASAAIVREQYLKLLG